MPPPPIPASAADVFTQITNPALQTMIIQRAAIPPANIRDNEHKRFRYITNNDTQQHYGILEGAHKGATVSLIGLIRVGPARLLAVEDENVNMFLGPRYDLKRVWVAAGGARRTQKKSRKSRKSKSLTRRSRRSRY
jgi:hypothetical protein